MIPIDDELSIPENELEFRASRSSGPGGQHVNKVNSRVTLRFDVRHSPSLSERQKCRIARKLPTRMTGEGVLWMSAQRHRSQAANRAELIVRFAELLREALKERTPRRPTRKPRKAEKKRLDQKKRRSDLKRTRGRPGADD